MNPAIADADLARLLGSANTVPSMPAGLADRIMAALPAALLTPAPVTAPPLPPVIRPRRRQTRWLRTSMAVVAGLSLASAVAAGLARTPIFAPMLAPVMERLAEVTGLPALAPRPQMRPTPAASTGQAPLRTATPAPIEAALPAQTTLPAPTLPAPTVVEAPRLAVPNRLQLTERAAPRALIERPVAKRPRAERLPAQRPLLDRPASDRPIPPDALTEPPQARAADAAPAAPINQGLADAIGEAVGNAPRTQRAVAATAKIETLREARNTGAMPAAQSQQLRALQQLRAVRAARSARDAAPRNRR